MTNSSGVFSTRWKAVAPLTLLSGRRRSAAELPAGERDILVDSLVVKLDAEMYAHLDEAVREDIVESIDNAVLADVVVELGSDEAVDFIEDLEEADQRAVLDVMPVQERVLLEDSLRFPEDSAGRLVRRDAATNPSYWNAGQTIDCMRSDVELPNDLYLMVVVGPTLQPIDVVPLSRLLRTTRPIGITEIKETNVRLIPATMDQEKVAFLFRQYDLVSASIVDEHGRLIGVIDVEDVVYVIDEEAE